MNDIQTIQSKIYEIRGQRVMLDFDLAVLYQVTTGNLNKAVKRNIKRFPPDFMFQLTKEEFAFLKQSLIFQNGITNEELKKAKGILRTGRGGVRQFEVTRDELSRCQIGTMNKKQGNSTSKASCMKHLVTTLR